MGLFGKKVVKQKKEHVAQKAEKLPEKDLPIAETKVEISQAEPVITVTVQNVASPVLVSASTDSKRCGRCNSILLKKVLGATIEYECDCGWKMCEDRK